MFVQEAWRQSCQRGRIRYAFANRVQDVGFREEVPRIPAEEALPGILSTTASGGKPSVSSEQYAPVTLLVGIKPDETGNEKTTDDRN